MAALGVLTLRPQFPGELAERLPVSDYDVIRGNYLGVVTVKDPATPVAELNPNLGVYIVRQIRVVYRQIWPTHGQRFPQ